MTYPEILLFIMMTSATIGLVFTIGSLLVLIVQALRGLEG